ncbi:putative elongation factor TypA-like SVR3, chloroplastic [Tanacetum coccineum]
MVGTGRGAGNWGVWRRGLVEDEEEEWGFNYFKTSFSVTSIEYDEHKGKIAIGQLYAEVLNRDIDVRICALVDACRFGKVNELFVFQKFFRVAVESVEAGDICAVCGVVLMIFRLFMVFMDKDVLTLRPDTNLDHMQLVNIGNQRSSLEDDAEVHRYVDSVLGYEKEKMKCCEIKYKS